MDKVIYTDESSKEDLFERLDILLSIFIRELSAREEKRVDSSK